MRKVDHFLVNGTGDTEPGALSPTDGKADITDELSKQESFSRFIKRKFPPRKPSSDLVKSIKDRIKMLDPQEQKSSIWFSLSDLLPIYYLFGFL